MSQEKQTILETWRNSDNNILINAKAGCGKTSTLLDIVSECEYITLFLAFNKSIQEEITQKLDSRGLQQGKAMTIHSLSLMAIKKHYNKVTINNGKYFGLVKWIQVNHKKYFKGMEWVDKSRLTFTLLDMNDISRMFLTDDIAEITKYSKIMDKKLFLHHHLPELWNIFVQERTEHLDNISSIDVDFTDMLWITVVKNLYIPIAPYYLLMDEIQDLSLLQYKVVKQLLSQGDVKKWCGVGDPLQSIYLFGGAMSDSFFKWREEENVVELGLSTCYRCPRAIIDEANDVFDVMQYGRGEEGFVDTIDNPALVKDNAMVICRHNSPLIALYFRLLYHNRNVYIKGDEILSSIIKFLGDYKHLTADVAEMTIQRKLNELKEKRDDDSRLEYVRLKENATIFKTLVTNLCDNRYMIVDLIINKLKSLFITKENAIMLCSMHKSKGLEADYVYILNEYLIPSPLAASPELLVQEQHLKYVARTRAKKELYYLNFE